MRQHSRRDTRARRRVGVGDATAGSGDLRGVAPRRLRRGLSGATVGGAFPRHAVHRADRWRHRGLRAAPGVALGRGRPAPDPLPARRRRTGWPTLSTSRSFLCSAWDSPERYSRVPGSDSTTSPGSRARSRSSCGRCGSSRCFWRTRRPSAARLSIGFWAVISDSVAACLPPATGPTPAAWRTAAVSMSWWVTAPTRRSPTLLKASAV